MPEKTIVQLSVENVKPGRGSARPVPPFTEANVEAAIALIEKHRPGWTRDAIEIFRDSAARDYEPRTDDSGSTGVLNASLFIIRAFNADLDFVKTVPEDDLWFHLMRLDYDIRLYLRRISGVSA